MVAKIVNLFLCFFFTFTLVPFFLSVECQICTRKSVFTKLQTEWFKFTYTETYRGNCWYKCIKTRVRVQNQPRELARRVVVDEKVCCEGYTRFDLGSDDNSLDCRPICMPPCINAYCISPGKCACNEGFVENSTQYCSPVCNVSCEHGSCIAPNTCQCNFGYSLVNGTCQPVCTEPCVNGTCTAPETCECLPGYRKSENNTCEPYCFNGCEHGRCVAPETCNCDPGWQLNEVNQCIARCNQPCGNGRCIAPDVCECNTGYMLKKNSSNETKEGLLCVPVCENCEGVCIGPYKCECKSFYEAKNVTADGGDCDCFVNCSDASRICDRTMCIDPFSLSSTIVDDEATEENGVSDITDPFFTSTILSTEAIAVEFGFTQDSNDTGILNNYTSNKLESDSTWVQSNWIYIVVVSVLALLILMSVLLIAKWKYLVIFFKGSSYVVEDSRDDAGTAQFGNIKFSSIINKSDTRK